MPPILEVHTDIAHDQSGVLQGTELYFYTAHLEVFLTRLESLDASETVVWRA